MITLCLPVYRPPESFSLLWERVARQQAPPCELILVDDGNEPPLIPDLRAFPFPVRLVRHDKNQGLAAARNSGWRAARTPIVAFLDADTLPPLEWTRRIGEHFCRADLAGAGGPGRESPGESLADRWRARFWAQTQGERAFDHADALAGLAMAWRRSALLELGGFDERFRRAGEDIELSRRAHLRGMRLCYDPALGVEHVRRDTLPSLVAMIARHAFGQQRALSIAGARLGRDSSLARMRALVEALRWSAVGMGSSLRRHHDPAMAALSAVAGVAHLGARLWAHLG